MKKIATRITSAFMALVMAATMVVGASAAAVPFDEAIVGKGAFASTKGKITIHKYDTTKAARAAAEGGVGWTDSDYVSDGKEDTAAETRLKDYALENVEFTILKMGDFLQYTQDLDAGGNAAQVVYGVPDAVQSILGLTPAQAVTTSGGVRYYTTVSIQRALEAKLAANRRDTVDKLEAYINGISTGTVTIKTNQTGEASTEKNLDLGLYLIVETKVPENVIETVDPFFVTLPFTDSYNADGSGNVENGAEWLYDIELYPKNQTGNPTLIKQVEDLNHGKAFKSATEGFHDVATLTEADTVTYRLVSKLPTITTAATYLSKYEFTDVMPAGISFDKGDNDVIVAIYDNETSAMNDYRAATSALEAKNVSVITDSALKAKEVWTKSSGNFDVTYTTEGSREKITVSINSTGLSKINTPAAATNQNGKYSDCYMVVYYNGTVKSTADMVVGDKGNGNEVMLNWKRTGDVSRHLNTLKDECMTYTYGVDLTKTFSDTTTGKFTDVEFTLENISNETGKFFLKARKDSDGVYYINGTTTNEAEATHFVPKADTGKLLVYGLEEDTYALTEVKTAHGYTLLKDKIEIDIDTAYDAGSPQTFHQANLPDDGSGRLTIEDTTFQVGSLTATAKVDGTSVPMVTMGSGTSASANALVPLKVLNTISTTLPKTGGAGTAIFTIGGMVMAGAGVALFALRKKED